jgi:hypothetical protein
MPDLADKQASSPGSDTRLEFAPRINVLEAASGPEQPWYRVPHLLRLNILLMVPLLTSYLVGFDGSMLNGVQTVPAWQNGTSLDPLGSCLLQTDTSISYC